jgi:hypothetical protein
MGMLLFHAGDSRLVPETAKRGFAMAGTGEIRR